MILTVADRCQMVTGRPASHEHAALGRWATPEGRWWQGVPWRWYDAAFAVQGILDGVLDLDYRP